jgi:Uncharacterised nucleotidyltransferase
MVYGPFSLDRMVLAVEKVRERLLRATAALEKAAIPYAVAGGNAVAVWVTRVDESAVRNTRDVDILVRRGDLTAVRAALESAGFTDRHSAGVDVFLDGPKAKARDGCTSFLPARKFATRNFCQTPMSRTPKWPIGSRCYRCRPWCRSSSRRFATKTARTAARVA